MAFEFLRSYIENSDTKKDIKKLEKVVAKINGFTDAIAKLSDEQLQAKTGQFKERLAKGETLDDLLPEAYAVVREASDRVLGLRHFDVQLMGGIILHQGPHCGNENRGRENPGGYAACLFECADGKGRSCDYCQ